MNFWGAGIATGFDLSKTKKYFFPYTLNPKLVNLQLDQRDEY